MAANGAKLSLRPKTARDSDDRINRAEEVGSLITNALHDHLIPYLQTADTELDTHISNGPETTPLPPSSPQSLEPLLPLSLPITGSGHSGLLSILSPLLQNSINTSSPGFLDKLYSAPSPPGLAAELILATLNTNLHVYAVSPALTLIERATATHLAALFGLTPENGCPRAGGISVQGGSASNMTSIVVARNTLFPRTKTEGNWAGAGGKELLMFTSAHGHYSIEKAAQACGFGSQSVIAVPVVPETGAMDPAALARLITLSREEGKLPFYVNATAGTTVLGSFDPFPSIAEICRREKLWMHIDASWGGGFVFSPELRRERLNGSELADSIAFNPHKMLQVPLTCSFLLGRDMRQFQRANEIASAGYLFHSADGNGDSDGNAVDDETTTSGQTILPSSSTSAANGTKPLSSSAAAAPTPLPTQDEEEEQASPWTPPPDLATLTLQCGRRGDSLKLFLAWHYYGTSGLAHQVESAHAVARHLSDLVRQSPSLRLVRGQRHHHLTTTTSTENGHGHGPPCLQVCFWYCGDEEQEQQQEEEKTRTGTGTETPTESGRGRGADPDPDLSKWTPSIVAALRTKGFMIDYAPPTAADAEEAWRGPFFRVVVNLRTRPETVERLVRGIERLGREIGEGK